MSELTSIFGFIAALEEQPGVDSAALGALLDQDGINSRAADGAGETNNGGVQTSLPVYHDITIDGPAVEVCSTNIAGTQNKLGVRSFLQFSVPSSQALTIEANVVSGSGGGSDPQIRVWQNGQLVIVSESETSGRESETRQFPSGEFVIEVFDEGNTEDEDDGVRFCYDVTVR